ncbi:hypothetical protein BJ741DRAFT_382339 [Chytriomyces cf. hyalinus JEL632]|nr:hypothetical protein BJ741DRAFT_382339 [Chytriomyces cf. hyalinus JEL632]
MCHTLLQTMTSHNHHRHGSHCPDHHRHQKQSVKADPTVVYSNPRSVLVLTHDITSSNLQVSVYERVIPPKANHPSSTTLLQPLCPSFRIPRITKTVRRSKNPTGIRELCRNHSSFAFAISRGIQFQMVLGMSREGRTGFFDAQCKQSSAIAFCRECRLFERTDAQGDEEGGTY